jgi:DNA-binding PadR family transcriptional regulator
MEYALGEFEQLVLMAVVRLEADAYGATIRREIEDRTGRRRKHFALQPAGARALKSAYRAYTGMAAGLERRLKTL